MIKGLRYLADKFRYLADKLCDIKCYIHIKWNALLEKLKSKCVCEKLQK